MCLLYWFISNDHTKTNVEACLLHVVQMCCVSYPESLEWTGGLLSWNCNVQDSKVCSSVLSYGSSTISATLLHPKGFVFIHSGYFNVPHSLAEELTLFYLPVGASRGRSLRNYNSMWWITRLTYRWRVQQTVLTNVKRRLLRSSVSRTQMAALGLPLATFDRVSAFTYRKT